MSLDRLNPLPGGLLPGRSLNPYFFLTFSIFTEPSPLIDEMQGKGTVTTPGTISDCVSLPFWPTGRRSQRRDRFPLFDSDILPVFRIDLQRGFSKTMLRASLFKLSQA